MEGNTTLNTRTCMDGNTINIHVPEDVLIAILLRLPVKTLLRSTCVCKSWWSLIKSPSFVAKHLRDAKNNERLLVKRYTPSRPGEPRAEIDSPCLSIHSDIESIGDPTTSGLDHSPFADYGSSVRFRGHCNGLVCLRDGKNMYLLNPATRELKHLPPSPSDLDYPEDLILWRIIDLGFGYDPLSDDYKVVRLANFHSMYTNCIHQKTDIYSLKTGSWRQVDALGVPDLPLKDHTYSVASFNGFINLVITLERARQRDAILSFHMSSEVIQEIGLPYACVINPVLAVLGESLALILGDWPGSNIDVWVMKNYGVKESWTKIYHIGSWNVLPLVYWKDELLVYNLYRPQMVLLPLVAGQQLRKVDVPPMRFRAVVYKESLISIRAICNQA